MVAQVRRHTLTRRQGRCPRLRRRRGACLSIGVGLRLTVRQLRAYLHRTGLSNEYERCQCDLLSRCSLFVVCEAFSALNRCAPAAEAAGLRILARTDIIPKEGR